MTRLERPDIVLIEDNYIAWETFIRNSWLTNEQKTDLERHMLNEWYSYPDMYASHLTKKGWRAIRCVASGNVTRPTISEHRLGHSVLQIPVKSGRQSGLRQARTFGNGLLKTFENPPRLVHFNSYYSAYFAFYGYRNRESLLTCQYSGGEPPMQGLTIERLKWKFPVQRALGKSKAVLIGTFSEEEMRQRGILKDYYGVSDDQIVDFPILAVDRSLFHERDKLESAREMGFDSNKLNLLVVSSVPHRPKQGSLSKDPFAVLAIFGEVARQKQNWSLHFVGFGPGFKELVAYADALGLNKHATFHGLVDHQLLPAFYSASDVVVNPVDSMDLRVGTATVEAFACNRPVVMFRRFPDSRFEQPGGYLIDRNPKVGAKEIASIMREGSKLKERAKGGREVAERYDLAGVVEKLSGIFHAILD